MTMHLIRMGRWLSSRPYRPVLMLVGALGAGIFVDGPLGLLLMSLLLAPATLSAALCLVRRPDRRSWRLVPDDPAAAASLDHVTLDSRLVTTGRHCVRHAALPFDLEPALRLRAQSGALLLATAATLTCSRATSAHKEGLIAALAPLGFSPERMARRSPVLGEAHLGDLTGPMTRDGLGQRAYFMADPVRLSGLCALIYDGAERPMTEEDRLRIAQTAQAMARQGEQPLAFAMAAGHAEPLQGVFLGMLSMGDEVSAEAAADVALLQRHGLTVAIADDPALIDPAALRRALNVSGDLQPRTLFVAASPDESSASAVCRLLPDVPGQTGFAQVIVDMRLHERRLRQLLIRLFASLGTLLGATVLLSAPWYAPVMVAAILLSGVAACRSMPCCPPKPRHGSIACAAAELLPAVVCLLLSAFLSWSGADEGRNAWLLALVVFACFDALRLLKSFCRRPALRKAWPIGAAALAWVCALVIVAHAGILPLAFSLLASLLTCLILLLWQRS